MRGFLVTGFGRYQVDNETVIRADFSNGAHLALNVESELDIIQVLDNRKPNEVFIMCKTFDEVTPESAELGDFSDNGFVTEDQFFSLSELIDEVSDLCVDGWDRFGNQLRFHSSPWTQCYKTGTERTETLHIQASEKNINRLMHALTERGLL